MAHIYMMCHAIAFNGKKPAHRRVFTFCLISMTAVFSLQYFLNQSEFREILLSLSTLLDDNIFSLALFFFSLIIIDVFSFYQTMIFLRLSQNIENLLELSFLAFGDLILSLSLVSFLIPFVVIAVFYFTFDKEEQRLILVFDNRDNQQVIHLRDVVRMTLPRIPHDDSADAIPSVQDNNRLADAMDENGWIYAVTSVGILPYKDGFQLSQDAIKDLYYNSIFVYFQSPSLPIEKIADSLAAVFEKEDGVIHARVLAAEASMFGREIIALDVKFDVKRPPMWWYIRSFWQNFDETYLLKNSVQEAISLNSRFVYYNKFIWSVMYQRNVLELFNNFSTYCQGKFKRVPNNNDAIDLKECNGLIVPQPSLSGKLLWPQFRYDEDIRLPIMPFALSSVFFTIVIYTGVIASFLLRVFFYVGARHVEGGDDFLRQHIFVIILSFIAVIYISVASLLNLAM